MFDLPKIRRAARISQVELSRRAQISRPRLSAAENGYLELTTNELRRIEAVVSEEPSRRADRIRQAFTDAALVAASM